MMNMSEIILKQTDTFIELDIILDGVQIGTAEIEPYKRQLERFNIWPPYQDKGYGQVVLDKLIREYKIQSLWVRSDNTRAIHVYDKAGFEKGEEAMYEMRRKDG